MYEKKNSLLILGASSFISKPLVEAIQEKFNFKIICQSRKNLNEDFSNYKNNIIFSNIDYSKDNYRIDYIQECRYVVNLINSANLNSNEIKNVRRFLEYILKISKADLIHISTASVYGICQDKIISEDSLCRPRNNYQKIKRLDEIYLQKLVNHLGTKLFILRPTEIIGYKSNNARKFIQNYTSSSFLKKYLIQSFNGLRTMHFVSCDYLVGTIIKIIEGENAPGIYLVSQDCDKANDFMEFSKIIEEVKPSRFYFLIYKFYKFPLYWLFKIIYRIFRKNQIPPDSKFISKKPIINVNDFYPLRQDLNSHIKYILKIPKKS
jgi:nucleoside-diphosphate-sugar epimerase